MAKNSNKAPKAETKAPAVQPVAKTEAPKAEPVVMVVATAKATKPNTFFARVQEAAKQPISLASLITGLQATHKTDAGKGLVPKSKKDHDMVVRVRTNYALNHGFISAVQAK